MPTAVRDVFTAELINGFERSALELCALCPARLPCAEFADTSGAEVGLWGGRRRHGDGGRSR